jgi:hypothetical protein
VAKKQPLIRKPLEDLNGGYRFQRFWLRDPAARWAESLMKEIEKGTKPWQS